MAYTIWFIPALIIFFDQITKSFVSKVFYLNQSFPIIQNILHLTYIRNKGAAFGVLINEQLLILVSIVVILAIIVYYFKEPFLSILMRISLSFILGGAASNLIDRIRFREVIDFIDIRIWPVFNFADSFISIGVGLFLLDVLMKKNIAAKNDK
jgi:signal peptidase II